MKNARNTLYGWNRKTFADLFRIGVGRGIIGRGEVYPRVKQSVFDQASY